MAPELFAAGLPRTGFGTAVHADNALSAVCVTFGRQMAGLSRLA
jgi:hypothetical protein